MYFQRACARLAHDTLNFSWVINSEDAHFHFPRKLMAVLKIKACSIRVNVGEQQSFQKVQSFSFKWLPNEYQKALRVKSHWMNNSDFQQNISCTLTIIMDDSHSQILWFQLYWKEQENYITCSELIAIFFWRLQTMIVWTPVKNLSQIKSVSICL